MSDLPELELPCACGAAEVMMMQGNYPPGVKIQCRTCFSQVIGATEEQAIGLWNEQRHSTAFRLEIKGFEGPHMLYIWAFPLPYSKSGSGAMRMWEANNRVAYRFFQRVDGQVLDAVIYEGLRPIFSMSGVKIHSPKSEMVLVSGPGRGDGPLSVTAVLEWADSEALGIDTPLERGRDD